MTNTTRASSFYIEYKMCPNTPEIELTADALSSNAKYFVASFVKCSGSASCKTPAQISSWALRKSIRITTLNSYYDGKLHTESVLTFEIEPTGTVEQYLDYNNDFGLSNDWYFKFIIEVTPTEIVYKNGTTQTIYEVGRIIRDRE